MNIHGIAKGILSKSKASVQNGISYEDDLRTVAGMPPGRLFMWTQPDNYDFTDATERIASQIFFPDEVNAEVFENWDPYREHRAKRTSFNHNDTFLDRNQDGRTDGVFCEVERVDRSGLAAKAVVTVDV
jgi:hypothetical protein